MDRPPWKSQIKSILNDNLIAGGLQVSVASKGLPPVNFHIGHANITEKESINETHLFGIGSITKVFIAVVILQLVEEGKLGLTDTASQYSSHEVLRDIDNAERATIKQLLGHKAGLDSWEDDPKWIVDGRGANINTTRIWGKTDTLEYVRQPRRIALKPGEWYYSNTNYTLLGLIIENITQNTAESEVRKRILESLGMQETFFDGFESPPPSRKVAGRYHYATPKFRETAGVSPFFPEIAPNIIEASGSNLSVSWTAGGMMSSAPDLIKFASALRDGRLLKPASMKILQDWTPTTLSGHEMGHGLFRMTLADKTSWIGHSGGVLGSCSGLWWNEDSDTIISVLSNLGTQHAGEVSRGVKNTVLNTGFLTLAAELPISPLSRTIRTERLTIRLADPKDEETCRTILMFYDPETRPDMQTSADVRKKAIDNRIDPTLCTRAIPPTGAFHLIYTAPSSPQPIGMVGFSSRPGWPYPDIGYKLMPESQGKGYAVEAVKAVLRFWREDVGVRDIFALVGEENGASRKVAERVGFVEDGRVRLEDGRGDRNEEVELDVAFVLPEMGGKVDWNRIVLK